MRTDSVNGLIRLPQELNMPEVKKNPMVNYNDIIKDTHSKNFNVHDKYKDNSYEKNVEICKKESLPFSIGVINVTGELNVGMMIRSACLMGAENFYIFGRKKFDKRSTVGAENYINIVQYVFDDPLHADDLILNQIRLLNYNIYICEQDGVALNEVDWFNSAKPDKKPMFLFGSESHGVPKNILDAGYNKISIPQRGVLRSFNVSAAMNVIVWDFIKTLL